MLLDGSVLSVMMYLGLLTLASDFVLLIWFQGSIFSYPRSYFESWTESTNRVKRFFGELVGCSLCLVVHVTFHLFIVSYCIPKGYIVLLVLASANIASRLYNMRFYDRDA